MLKNMNRVVRVTTIAGKERGFCDGPLEEARFDYPDNIAISPNGDIFLTDWFAATFV